MGVYNAEPYLSQSIESILNQSFSDFEFIIINDGSVDQSLSVIKSYNDSRIKIINQKNSGAATARNTGLKYATGEYIAIQDADDISFNDRLQRQFNFLNSNNDYVLVGSNAMIIDEQGLHIYNSNVLQNDIDLKKIITSMPFYHPSIFFKKKECDLIDGYPDYMENICEDVVFISRISKMGKVANLNERLIKYRVRIFLL